MVQNKIQGVQMVYVEIPGLRAILQAGIELSRTKEYIEKAGELIKGEWQHITVKETMQRHAAWFAKNYARNIDVLENDDFSVTIGVKDKNNPGANAIENGRDEYDMKPALVNSKRARMSRKGERYTIIAFRHGMEKVKSAIPETQIKKATVMTKVGEKMGTNADKQRVPRNVYSYSSSGMGKRIGANLPPLKDHHKHNPLEGLVMTRQEVGKKRPSGKHQHQAITFRIVKINSDGWMFPRIQAESSLDKIANRVSKYIDMVLGGLREDIKDFQKRIDETKG